MVLRGLRPVWRRRPGTVLMSTGPQRPCREHRSRRVGALLRSTHVQDARGPQCSHRKLHRHLGGHHVHDRFLGATARCLHVASATLGRPRSALQGLVRDSTGRATAHRLHSWRAPEEWPGGTCPHHHPSGVLQGGFSRPGLGLPTSSHWLKAQLGFLTTQMT